MAKRSGSGGWGTTLTGYAATKDNLEETKRLFEQMSSHVVYSDVEYAVYVEFGTSRMPANGALRASVQDTLGNLESLVEDASSAEDISRVIAEDIAEGWRNDVWVDTGRLRDSITVKRA